MTVTSIHLDTNVDKTKKIPFTAYDFGWVVLCIGMAIGSGIVFMPVQIGLKGLWVFLAAVGLSYPAVYYLQELFLRTLIQSEKCDSYANIISHYLGKNWGIALGVVYFLMLLTGVLTYSTAITYDSSSYLQTFKLTEQSYSDYAWYGLIVVSLLVFISAQGERFLFKIAGPMVIVKFSIIVTLAVIMVPYWSLANLQQLPNFFTFFRDVLLTLPFALFSILYVQILSPMNIAYRKLEKDPLVAAYRSVRANRLAYRTIVIAVLFFAISFSFSITKEEAVQALEQNISALAIAAKVIPGAWVQGMSVLLNVFAIMSAFFGIYMGFHEAVKGIVDNLLSRFIPESRINAKLVSLSITIGIVFFLWAWVSTRFSTMLLLQLSGPIFGITACLVPCYLVWKVKSLQNLRTPAAFYVVFYGVLLVASPLLKFFE
ncbi:transporter [Pseudomonas atacamensis]|uniref:Transporter n=1 Tax=Pseudomonas atacamensis TaxID=2565368 RepID=A0AAQ2D733_9PSED|nr:amino acid permease [Pseudomonas atacamensis]THF25788.1 transporter [Pseudomonas atacamensis]